MLTIEEFHEQFVQDILTQSESVGSLKAEMFFENICEKLHEIGDLTHNYQLAEYRKRGIEVFGFDYDKERELFSLIVHELFQKDNIQTVTRDLIKTKFTRLKKFYSECISGLYKELEPAFPAYELAELIFRLNQNSKINKLNFIFITDGKITRSLNELPIDEDFEIPIHFQLIDIDYLYKINLSENSGGDFNIKTSLPSLPILDSEYNSYLCVVNGDDLYDIYEQFGQKIFEKNVRTFLQFRSNVNKGLRNTIQYYPNKFFAYNNGLTATATSIEIDDNNLIKSVENLQIVNGCQTTSAIYAAKKQSKLDISSISLQMKLTVMNDQENQGDFVAKVSEYANTQNKVNKSDFFSNHQYHIDVKNKSKRILAPSVGGSQKRTKWFYERVRGEYLNEQAYLTQSQKKQFLLENPKRQMFDKKFLAKTENIWRRLPHIVSKGAEFNFQKFAEYITNKFTDESQQTFISDDEFREMVSRIILFRTTEIETSRSEWYNGGFRAQTVVYSLAFFSNYLTLNKIKLDWSKIWELQYIPDNLLDNILKIGERVYETLLNPPAGNANAASWSKKEQCWKTIKELKIKLAIDPEFLLDDIKVSSIQKKQKKQIKLDSSIDRQMFVYSIDKTKWNSLRKYYLDDETYINNTQLGVLESASNGSLKNPSEKQSKILYDLFFKANKEGFSWD